MSRVLKDLPPPRGRPAQYPWNDWFDGRVHVLERGKDFPDDKDMRIFRMQAYNAGTRRGFKVHTRVRNEDTIIVQAEKK